MTPGHARHCVRCGAHIADGMKFCGACGTPAVAVTPPAPQFAPQAAPQGWSTPVAPAAAPVAPQYAPPQSAPMVPTQLASNPQKTVAVVWLFVSFAAAGAAVLPFIADIDMMKGGGAMVMLGGVVSLTGLIVAVMYFGRASAFTRILTTERLVYWRYAPDEWARYTEAEHGRQKSDMRSLWITLAVISAVVGVGFLIADPDAGKVVFLVLMGVVALCGLVAILSTRSAHSRNKARVGDVYISRSGVYLNEVLHTWTGFGASLDGVAYEEGDPALIVFSYSMPSRTGRQTADVRVPVPRGQEVVARGLAAQFQAGVARG